MFVSTEHPCWCQDHPVCLQLLTILIGQGHISRLHVLSEVSKCILLYWFRFLLQDQQTNELTNIYSQAFVATLPLQVKYRPFVVVEMVQYWFPDLSTLYFISFLGTPLAWPVLLPGGKTLAIKSKPHSTPVPVLLLLLLLLLLCHAQGTPITDIWIRVKCMHHTYELHTHMYQDQG